MSKVLGSSNKNGRVARSIWSSKTRHTENSRSRSFVNTSALIKKLTICTLCSTCGQNWCFWVGPSQPSVTSATYNKWHSRYLASWSASISSVNKTTSVASPPASWPLAASLLPRSTSIENPTRSAFLRQSATSPPPKDCSLNLLRSRRTRKRQV